MYWTPTLVTLGRTDARSRLTGCLGTSLVRLELLVLVVGGDPLRDKTEGQDLGIAGQETFACELCYFYFVSFSQDLCFAVVPPLEKHHNSHVPSKGQTNPKPRVNPDCASSRLRG